MELRLFCCNSLASGPTAPVHWLHKQIVINEQFLATFVFRVQGDCFDPCCHYTPVGKKHWQKGILTGGSHSV